MFSGFLSSKKAQNKIQYLLYPYFGRLSTARFHKKRAKAALPLGNTAFALALQHAEGGELFAQRRFQSVADFGKRQAELAPRKTEQLHRVFQRRGVGLGKEQRNEPRVFVREVPRRVKVAVHRRMRHCRDGGGCEVGQHRDHAASAERGDGQDLVVASAVDRKPPVGAEPRELCHVAGRLLDGADVRDVGKGGILCFGEVHAGAGGNVVEDHGASACRVGDAAVVLEDAVRRPLVAVGRDGEQRVRAAGDCVCRQRACCLGVGAAAAGDQRHFPRRERPCRAEQAAAFAARERCRFAGRARHAERVGAHVDLPFDQPLGGGKVDFTARKRRGKRRCRAREERVSLCMFFHSNLYLNFCEEWFIIKASIFNV